jgi:hypothetical protein
MRGALLVAAASFCAWHPAYAQAGAEPARQSLTVSMGMVEDTRRDAADSPLAYSGNGPGARMDYDRVREGNRFHLSLTAGGSTLTPSGAVPLPDIPLQEAVSLYALEAGMEWRLRGGPARGGDVAIGVEFGATVTVARHLFAGQDISQQDFDLGVATLAPTARWTRRLGAGQLAAALAVPLLAWVDHPYADVRYAQQLMSVHFAPLSQFHQADGELSYAFWPESRTGITASYRIGMFELDGLEPVRRVSQSFSVGVVRRFGALP